MLAAAFLGHFTPHSRPDGRAVHLVSTLPHRDVCAPHFGRLHRASVVLRCIYPPSRCDDKERSATNNMLIAEARTSHLLTRGDGARSTLSCIFLSSPLKRVSRHGFLRLGWMSRRVTLIMLRALSSSIGTRYNVQCHLAAISLRGTGSHA